MTEYLAPPELHTLTGYARRTQQASWLVERGIPHRLDGPRLIVSRVHVQQWLVSTHAPREGATSSTALTDRHYRTKATKLKAVR